MKRLIYFLVLALVLGGAAWSQAYADGATIQQWVPPEAVKAAGGYWTADRMRNAKPYPMATQSQDAALGIPEAGPTGPPGFEKAGPPSQTSALLSKDEYAALLYTGAFGAGYDYPPPQNTFRVPDYLYGTTAVYWYYRSIGKVFFTSGGYNYVCSGSSIGGRAVLTAGHCVSDGKGNFHTNEVFVPSYRNGLRPYGTWTATWKTTFAAWHTGGQRGRDVGFFTVADQSGVKLSARVSWLGFAYNWSRLQMWNMFGYPSAAPYNGQYLYCTQASYARTDTLKTPNTTGAGTAQRPGCSGGPWIVRFMNGDYANGVFSYFYTTPNQPDEMYTPYFDTSVYNMWLTAKAR